MMLSQFVLERLLNSDNSGVSTGFGSLILIVIHLALRFKRNRWCLLKATAASLNGLEVLRTSATKLVPADSLRMLARNHRLHSLAIVLAVLAIDE